MWAVGIGVTGVITVVVVGLMGVFVLGWFGLVVLVAAVAVAVKLIATVCRPKKAQKDDYTKDWKHPEGWDDKPEVWRKGY